MTQNLLLSFGFFIIGTSDISYAMMKTGSEENNGWARRGFIPPRQVHQNRDRERRVEYLPREEGTVKWDATRKMFYTGNPLPAAAPDITLTPIPLSEGESMVVYAVGSSTESLPSSLSSSTLSSSTELHAD